MKKKKKKGQNKAESQVDDNKKSRYQEELANVVGKSTPTSEPAISDTELDDLTSGLDDTSKPASDTMVIDPEDIDTDGLEAIEDDSLGDDLDVPSTDDDDLDLDALLSDDEDDLELAKDDAAEEPVVKKPKVKLIKRKAKKNDTNVESDDPLDALKQKPVKVVDEETGKLRELQSKDIDDVDDFDGLTTEGAISLVSDVEDEEEPVDDSLDLDEDWSEDDDSLNNSTGEDLEDLVNDDDNDLDLEEELVDDDDDGLDVAGEEPEPEAVSEVKEPAASKEITPEEAFKALPPVQQLILRQMDKLSVDEVKTQAQMVQENLYMQSQITEWANAYAGVMQHLNDWQEYSTKLRDLLISQNAEFEEEKEHLNHRHQIQMRNLRASLEDDYAEREDKILHDQRIAKDMIEQASTLLKQAKSHDDSSRSTIEGLQKQINILTTRPKLATDGPISVAPSGTTDDIFATLGLTRHATLPLSSNDAEIKDGELSTTDTAPVTQEETVSEDADDVDDLFNDANWD